MALDTDTRQRIDTLLASSRIVLFMKGEPRAPQCGFSAKAVAALNALDTPYVHVDVLADGAIREGIKAYGDWPTIPQLYIDGELVGGSDIIEQMSNSGELHGALGLPAPDRTPPAITVTPAALEMLRKAIEDAGGGVVVRIDIDPAFRTRLQLAQDDANAITVTVDDGVRVQFGIGDARRAEGITVDFADDLRGRGLVVENPNAPKPIAELSPKEANERLAAGTLTLVDVRPADERAKAKLDVTVLTIDDGLDEIEALPKQTPMAFLCHHGSRSAEAAAHFRGLGFANVYNVTGGIDAWSDGVDSRIPKY